MTPQVKIFLATAPVDLRGSFDRLAAATRSVLNQDPCCGALFTNRARNRLKVLWWDRNGYILPYKRLVRKSFQLPQVSDTKAASIQISRETFASILATMGVPEVPNSH